MQLKFDWMERLFNGRAKLLVENGQIQTRNLHSLRMSVDQLEMRLRQNGIARISDVKYVTLKPKGELGYELMRHAQQVTVGDLERLLQVRLAAPPELHTMFQETAGQRHPSPTDPKLQ
ncbi:YetF domain-containing protein [Paenibacillus tengchongensis]|uniref:YetF domain-containing protein n=1 Tax=Paenibacillus tengchongensis TaxID=2608684 RepID=UPI00124C7233|nr:YetF domain-containing protein [Paenibacillus tengchongensis]